MEISELGRVAVKIVADLDPLTRGFDLAKQKSHDFDRSLSGSLKGASAEAAVFGNTVAGSAQRAAREFDLVGRSSLVAGAAMRQVSALMGGLGVAVGGAFALRQFVENTIEAERVQGQLSAALQSTGGAARQTINDLNDHATALQRVTAFEDDVIGSAQSLMLTFQNIRGDTFNAATDAVLDLSVAMHQDLRSSALQLGKALNSPTEGISALTRVGVAFSEGQKNVISSMVATGNVAGAQAVILRELQAEFGGSARAARDTLGGALSSLSNAWGNLFELPRASSERLRTSIERVTDAISDPAFGHAVTTIGSGLFWALETAAAGAKAFADEVNNLSMAIDRFGANPNLDTFLSMGGMTLVEGGPADQLRDFVVGFERSMADIRAEITATQAALERTDPSAPFAGRFADQALQRLGALRAELRGVEMQGHVTATALHRLSEDASMNLLGKFQENAAAQLAGPMRRAAQDVSGIFEIAGESFADFGDKADGAAQRAATSIRSIADVQRESLSSFVSARDELKTTEVALDHYRGAIAAARGLPVSAVLGDVSDLRNASAELDHAGGVIAKLFASFDRGGMSARTLMEGVDMVRAGLHAIAGQGNAVDGFIDGLVKAYARSGALESQVTSLSNAISGIPDKTVTIRTIYDVGNGGSVGVTRHVANATMQDWVNVSPAEREAIFRGQMTADQALGTGDAGATLHHINVADFLSGKRAAGGPVGAAATYLVGEEGPELLRMGGAGGHVSSASTTAAILSGGADKLTAIEENTFLTVEELKGVIGYLETMQNDGEQSLLSLKSIDKGIGGLKDALASLRSSGGGGTSGAAASGAFGGGSWGGGGGGGGFSSNDARSPYYYSAGGGRPGGAQYDPVADYMFNGNQGALGLIASRPYGQYEATPWNSPFDVNRNRFQTNAAIATALGEQGPSGGAYGGGLNITAESDFTSGSGFFANGGRLAAGGMGGGIAPWPGLRADTAAICEALGITEDQLRQMQLSDIKTYGFAGGGAIHPGDTQRVEAWKNPAEAVAFFRPEQRAAVGDAIQSKGGDKINNVTQHLTINLRSDNGQISPQSMMALRDQLRRTVLDAADGIG